MNMKRILPVLPIAMFFGTVACDHTPYGTQSALPPQSPTTNMAVASPVATADQPDKLVTVGDLMQSLDLRIFKTRINEPGLKSVRRIGLCAKLQNAEPTEIVSVEIADATTPGTLLIFLEASDHHGYSYRAGINYADDNGRTHKVSGVLKEAMFRNVTGVKSGTGIINQPGTAIIECNGTFHGDEAEIATTPDAAAIFVRLE